MVFGCGAHFNTVLYEWCVRFRVVSEWRWGWCRMHRCRHGCTGKIRKQHTLAPPPPPHPRPVPGPLKTTVNRTCLSLTLPMERKTNLCRDILSPSLPVLPSPPSKAPAQNPLNGPKSAPPLRSKRGCPASERPYLLCLLRFHTP